MKKNLLLLALTVLALTATARADNQSSIVDGNGQFTDMGTVYLATTSTPDQNTSAESLKAETRRVRVTNTGKLSVVNVVNRSSYTEAASSTATYIIDAVSNSTFPLTYNPNVLDVASSSEPIRLKGFMLGDAYNERIRLFDSRGSTDIAFKRYDVTVGSATDKTFDVWFSSGLTVMKSGTGKLLYLWESMKQKYYP